nr:hypothetical protein [Tanacetum cinerariifolium]
AFTASSTIPSIYIQQFWDTVRYDKSVGCYKCQLDEQWFDLTKDALRDALQITPVNNNQAFTSRPSSDALINFVNELGYPKLIRNLSNVVTNDMFQRWRALTTIINMCLTGKTLGFKRPRAPVLQILWGNLAQHTHGKKKATLIVIPSIRFTKLIIYHLQNIQGESYYQEYLEKVAKHQRYITGETGSDPDSPAPKPTKTAKKSKPTAPKTQGKKRKLVTEISNKPSQARKSRPGLVSKRCKPISSLRLVDESVAKEIPEKEPRVDDEEANVQRALEESLKIMYDVPWGLLPPVVIRKPEFGKYQPLLEVSGKGKENVTEEHVARDLLTLQTPKKYSPADRYIFQRRTSTPTGSSGHDESLSLYDELRLTDSEEESDKNAGSNPDEQVEGQAGPNPDVSAQPHPEQMDEGFTTTAYPKIQENFKLTVEEQNHFRDLPEADMKEILNQRMWETVSYKTHEDHMQLYEALEKSMNRDHSKELLKYLAEARKKKKERRDSPKMPPGSLPHQPPPPLPAGPSRALGSPGASGSSQVTPPPPPPPSTNQEDLQMDDDMALDAQAQSSDDENIRNAHIPKKNWASTLASTYSPPPEDSLLSQSGDMAMFMDWLLSMEECHKLLIDSVDDSILSHNVSKPLPLGGPPRQVTIQSEFFFNKDLEYLRYVSKGSRPALSILKMKAGYYPDVGLEQMVPDQMWIEEECKYDIAAMYGISHRWFQRQRFYIDIQTSEEDFQLGIESYQTQLNLTKPQRDATSFEYKHGYTIDEALDYRVKEFKINRMNPGLNTRVWTRKDVDRSKEFMFAIQKRLKTRRIFRNLESFVSGRVRDGDYRLLKRTR